MSNSSDKNQDRLIAELGRLWQEPQDQARIERTIRALASRYDLNRKMAKEPGVIEIIEQMAGRLRRSYERLAEFQNKSILDIACGSNTSKLPAAMQINTPFGKASFGGGRGYTALFEPWFCRLLFELQAAPVGVDFGDLEGEAFLYHRVDLGKPGSLDFLPAHTFDGIQDSRLFGSPEFTAQFPDPADRLEVAREIVRQEQRLLKPEGIIIHSDARAMLRE
jgi:hypothetical protein